MIKKQMHFRRIDDMNHTILGGLPRIPREVDLIVGIPRSGLLAANMLSLYLNRPLTDLNGLGERRLLSTGKRHVANNDSSVFDRARRILIVDDCISQGTEIKKAREKVANFGFADRAIYHCVYSFPENPDLVDIVFEVIPRPMCFQWSCMHTRELANYCVDIDGVLCCDATKAEDDDGPNYREFIRNARPLFTPTVEIGWLVTSRLEKYREPTVEWLARHNIRYRHLIMMDCPTQAERARSGAHVTFKAEAYRKSSAILFIESSAGHAREIAEVSGLPVMCINPGQLFRRPASERIEVMAQRVERIVRRIKNAPARVAAKLLPSRRARPM